jgi:hypothetical protein
MEVHMVRLISVIAVLAAFGGAASLVLGRVGEDLNGTTKNNVEVSVSSRDATVTVTAHPPRASRTMHASEATMALTAGDSRLDNYRLERESCCIGND